MLKVLKDTISILLFIVALDNGATINITSIIDELNQLIDGRTNIDELTFDELLDIMKILKQHISNAAWVSSHSDIKHQSDFLFLYLTWLYIIISV